MAKIIVEVVEACHSLGVMLRNLKPNSLLFLDKYDDSSVKYDDFWVLYFLQTMRFLVLCFQVVED